VTEVKVGIEVAKQMAGGKLSGTLEYLSRSSNGDASFDVSMFGTSASGSTQSRTDGFGKIGLAYEAQLGNGSSLDIAASANVGGSGIGGQTVSATYSFDFWFLSSQNGKGPQFRGFFHGRRGVPRKGQDVKP
jgi:hypothetical protein